MTDPLDSDDGLVPASPPVGEEGVEPRPLVVIQYRGARFGSSLWPPLLIILAAVAITSHQRQGRLLLPPRPRAGAVATAVERAQPLQADAAPPPGGDTHQAASGPLPAQGPVEATPVAASLAEPAREPTSGPEPSAPLAASNEPADDAQAAPSDPGGTPERLPAPERAVDAPPSAPLPAAGQERPSLEPGGAPAGPAPAIGFDPTTRPEPPPQPSPAVSRQEVLRAIEREALERRQEQQALEDAKTQTRVLQVQDAWRKAQDDRADFHAELRRILRRRGDRAAAEIEDLCDQFGRETLPEIREAVRLQLRRSTTGMSRQGTVDLMRRYGYPEPLILDYLCHHVHRFLNSRGGPRNTDDVRVLAARTLLSYPVARPAHARQSADPEPSGDGGLRDPRMASPGPGRPLRP